MSVASQSSEPTPRKQFSILVIQLGEIEDVFRSLMALKAVKHLYPEMKLHVIARKEVSAPLKRVDWLSGVIETPSFQKGEDPIQRVALWIDLVINIHYDILVNWTHSDRHMRMAAIATSLIPAAVKLGNSLRDDMTLGQNDAWSIYWNAWLKNGVSQDIHQTDIITTQLLTALQIHVGDPNPNASSSPVTSRYFFKNTGSAPHPLWINRSKNLKWIAIHAQSIGDRGEEMVEMALRRHPDAGVVLLGEVPCSWDVVENSRVIDLCGELHLDLLIQVLSQSAWLISGKNAIVDLASLVNLRVVYLTEPNEQKDSMKWTEEGPYGNGHIVLTRTEEWNPEVIYGAWSYYYSEWFHKGSLSLQTHFENLALASNLAKTQIFRSRIRPADEGGGVCYERSGDQPHSFEGWIYRVRGQLARAWFCGWLPSVDQEISRIKLSPELIKRVREVRESMEVMNRLAEQGREIAKDLAHATNSLKNGYLMSVEDRVIIEEKSKKLLEVEGLMSRVVHVEPDLKCMQLWYQYLMHNLKGETIAQMALETIHAFDLISEGADLIQLYAKKTLDLAKPKSVSSEVPRALQPVK